MAQPRTVEVLGAKQTIAVLKRFEPDFAKEFERELREVGNEVAMRARLGVPSNFPISGWGPGGRTGFRQAEIRAGIGVRTFPRRKYGTTDQAIVGITSASAAGMIFERAGIRNRIKAPQGRSFIQALNDNYGKGLRLVGRAANASRKDTEQKIDDIVRRVSGDLQDSLNQAGVTRV